MVPSLLLKQPLIRGIFLRLDDIGFYTLSDERARCASVGSPLYRCELILTDRCNFKCPYCRGLQNIVSQDISYSTAIRTIDSWFYIGGLKNIRFSGGEPTLHEFIVPIIHRAKINGIDRIALSTNGSADTELYHELYVSGVNDFSISLDSGCCSVGEKLTGGVKGSWDKAVDNIKYLSKLTYVTVGMVFNEDNINSAVESIKFVSGLGVADIRIISSSQYNKAIDNLQELPNSILEKHPILKYRVDNYIKGRSIRGLTSNDSSYCSLVLDDMAVAGGYHYPCIIYMRQHGKPIGRIGTIDTVRKERLNWSLHHNCMEDPICNENCLDVCVDYNNRFDYYKKNGCGAHNG